MIFQVPHWDVANIWPRVGTLVQRALDRQREWGLADIHEQLLAQRMQLWVVPWEMAVVTQIQTYPGVRICMVVLCGGEGLHPHKQEFDEIVGWAKGLACDEIRIQGREGWRRIYPAFEKTGTLLRMTL
jgi:hypothetical protein